MTNATISMPCPSAVATADTDVYVDKDETRTLTRYDFDKLTHYPEWE